MRTRSRFERGLVGLLLVMVVLPLGPGEQVTVNGVTIKVLGANSDGDSVLVTK
jgi:hypothetical protein